MAWPIPNRRERFVANHNKMTFVARASSSQSRLFALRDSPELSDMIRASLKHEYPGEADGLAGIIRTEVSIPHLTAIFEMMQRPKSVTGVDYMWKFSQLSRSKAIALDSIDELRGIIHGAGSGVKCGKCHKNSATIQAAQTRAGDEATAMSISCMECGHVQIVG